MFRPRLWVSLAIALVALAPSGLRAEPFRYPEAKHGKGELKYIDGIPVVVLEGKPSEIGAQIAILAAKPAGKLLDYPKDFLKAIKLDFTWPVLVNMGKALLPNFPPDHLQELENGVKAANLDRDLFVAANTMFDLKKVIGCSTLIVEPERSVTKGTLLGRNLDFPTLGYLHEYSMVMVVRPTGKHAFVSIGFPGCVGVLSGMNDAGLALAVLEAYSANDNSPKFDPEGIPYALCFRRMLEECTTVEEAEKLLRSTKRTTRINLAICDKKGGAVFEITPKTVAVRRADKGLCPCTNHFRTKELATDTRCWRYSILEKCQQTDKLDVAMISKKLNEVHQGGMTLQTMVFEPAALKLHLALGKPPTSALPLKTLDLAPLLQKKD